MYCKISNRPPEAHVLGSYFLPVTRVTGQLREFNEKMKVWAPEQMHRWGFRHSPEYIRDRKAMRGMTYDEEVGRKRKRALCQYGLAQLEAVHSSGVIMDPSTSLPSFLL